MKYFYKYILVLTFLLILNKTIYGQSTQIKCLIENGYIPKDIKGKKILFVFTTYNEQLDSLKLKYSNALAQITDSIYKRQILKLKWDEYPMHMLYNTKKLSKHRKKTVKLAQKYLYDDIEILSFEEFKEYDIGEFDYAFIQEVSQNGMEDEKPYLFSIILSWKFIDLRNNFNYFSFPPWEETSIKVLNNCSSHFNGNLDKELFKYMGSIK
jgi:hypothetical protein